MKETRTYYDPDDHSVHDELLSDRMEYQVELGDRLRDEMIDREWEEKQTKQNDEYRI